MPAITVAAMNTAVAGPWNAKELERSALQQALRDRAREMVPRLRERAKHTAELHHLPEETVQEMIEAGFFRILQPARHGGFELEPKDFFDVQITLAEGCMSTAWVLGVVAIHNWQLGLFDERAQRDVWGTNDDTLISSSYMPVGKVKRVEGGYRLSGKWSFSSGSEHCDWAFLGAMVPPATPGEAPDYRTFLVPRGEYRIEANWDVSGLEGTGSNDIVVEDAFVPGDLVVAVVASLGDAASFFLTTAAPSCGVVAARSAAVITGCGACAPISARNSAARTRTRRSGSSAANRFAVATSGSAARPWLLHAISAQ
jgi:alkylation response protein AidB-like acyl-CoA dehydrogenase